MGSYRNIKVLLLINIVMKLFSEFGRLALAKENSRCSSSSTEKLFQRMVFLIRDWRNAREYPHGDQGGRDFINNYLTENGKEGELSDRRKQIRNLYEQVDCYLMPYPGGKVANDDPDFKCQSSGNVKIKFYPSKFYCLVFSHLFFMVY